MSDQSTVRITLVVKGDAQSALEEVDRRLREKVTSWFRESMEPPYPEGSLLWYRIDEGRVTIGEAAAGE